MGNYSRPASINVARHLRKKETQRGSNLLSLVIWLFAERLRFFPSPMTPHPGTRWGFTFQEIRGTGGTCLQAFRSFWPFP